MTAVDYIVTVSIGVSAGAILGPMLGYWSLLWQDRVHLHRAHCGFCQCRSTRRAMRAARRA